ncbi:MAG: hypothetical protein ACI9H6_000334 [Patiriisocius sp.]|jgi:hypothetical protein
MADKVTDLIKGHNVDAHNIKPATELSWGKSFSYIASGLSYLITISFNEHGGSYCWLRPV